MECEDEQERLIEQQERDRPHSERHKIRQWWCHLCLQQPGAQSSPTRRTCSSVDDGLPF